MLALDMLEVAAGSSSSGGGSRSLLLSGSKDNSMRLWEVPSGRCLGEPFAVAFSSWLSASPRYQICQMHQHIHAVFCSSASVPAACRRGRGPHRCSECRCVLAAWSQVRRLRRRRQATEGDSDVLLLMIQSTPKLEHTIFAAWWAAHCVGCSFAHQDCPQHYSQQRILLTKASISGMPP